MAKSPAPEGAPRARLTLSGKKPAAPAAPASARPPARPKGPVRPRTGGGGGVGPGSGGLRSTLRSDAPPPERQGGPRGQVQPDVPGGVRLNKRLADQGLCSRREADDWIARGWVTVDGVVAVMGQLVAPRSRVEVLPQARQSQEDRVTILLHKPVGYVSGQPEDGHESAAVLISPRSRWKDDHSPRRFQAQHTRGLAPAGRLDIDSTGLLVLTQDGRVARTIIGEDSEIEKEYLVRVHHVGLGPDAHPSAPLATEDVQSVFPAEQLARLRHGLSLDGQALRPAQVDWQNPEQLRFVLTEGKKRQIRRMCEQVGLHVVGLKRVRIGHITLGQLPVGQWRYLLPNERF